MKTIKERQQVQIAVKKSELLDGKWLCLSVLSERLKQMETERNMTNRKLRVGLYNSRYGHKYNLGKIGGIECISVANPMKTTPAALELKFKVEAD